MYSAVRSLLHFLQMKQKRCQCLSMATRDWQLLMDSLQPAHSVGREDVLHITMLLKEASLYMMLKEVSL